MRLLLLIIIFTQFYSLVKAQKVKSNTTTKDVSDVKKRQKGGQKTLKQKKRKEKNIEHIIKLGYISGFGTGQRFDDYDVSIYMPEMFVQMWQKGTWSIDLLGQPHFAFTHYEVTDENIGRLNPKTGKVFGLNSNNDKKSGFEFGFNVGWVLRKSIYKDFVDFYFLPSIGPHYVSGVPLRQVSGFIFSDNLYVGMSAKLRKMLYADARVGFRHISNADTVLPNRGINSYILLIGIYYILN